jgi:hypothetical protein
MYAQPRYHVRRKGGSLKSIAKGVRKAFTSKTAKKVGKTIAKGVEAGKKYVPRNVAKKVATEAVKAGLTATGMGEYAPVATKGIGAVVDATYDTNLSKGNVGKNFGRNLARRGKDAAVDYAKQSLKDSMKSSVKEGGALFMDSSYAPGPTGTALVSYRDQNAGRFLAMHNNQTGAYLPRGIVAGAGFKQGSGFLQ